MTKKLTCKQFTNLKKEWDKKLEESGFVDIENYSKIPMRRAYNQDKNNDIFSKTEYYRLLTHGLTENTIEDKAERLIIEWTAEGKTIREISKLLKKAKLKKCNKDTIRYIRRRYENKWGIRQWNPVEMVSRRVKKPATP